MTTDTLTLTGFLLARIAEDEEVARAAGGLAWTSTIRVDPDDPRGSIDDSEGRVVVYDEGDPSPAQAAHIARHDPARILAQCAAYRAIVEGHASGAWWDPVCGDDCETLMALASIWADHEDYRAEWAS